MGAARPNTVWVVVQARTGSTRLPGKVVELLSTRTVLEHVVGRCERIAPTCVAIPESDDLLAAFCRKRDIRFFRGPEDDVLERFALAAASLEAAHVVRVTADCPFLDVEAARWTIQHHLESKADFTHHIAEGRGIEVFTRDALESSLRMTGPDWEPWGNSDPRYREHPDEWILNSPSMYHIELMKFSVDTPADLDLARRRLNGPHILVS